MRHRAVIGRDTTGDEGVIILTRQPYQWVTDGVDHGLSDTGCVRGANAHAHSCECLV